MSVTLNLSRDGYSGNTLFSVDLDPSRLSPTVSSFGLGLFLPYKPKGDAKVLQMAGTLAFYGESAGLPIPSQPLLFNRNGLDIPISGDQLARLERKRAVGELNFDLMLTALAATPDGLEILSATSPASISVPREVWMRVLEAFDGRHRRIVELPAVPPFGAQRWAGADAALQDAARRLAAGDPGGCVAEARTALEKTTAALGDLVGYPRASGDAFRNHAEKLASMMDAKHVKRSNDPYALLARCLELSVPLFGFASEVSHQGLSATTLPEAELAISLATSLYSFGVRMPQNAEAAVEAPSSN